jgi:hypothetical protein
MEPTLLPKTETRKFRSEAEYRLWQHEVAADAGNGKRGNGLVSRVVNAVRNLAPQQKNAPREKSQRINDRRSRRPAKQHS